MKVLNFGSINLDYNYRVPYLGRPGETISATSFQIMAGGKGANQSVALAKAGAKVFHAGKVGDDGLWIKDKLRFLGVDSSHVRLSGEPSGHAVIQVDENSFYVESSEGKICYRLSVEEDQLSCTCEVFARNIRLDPKLPVQAHHVGAELRLGRSPGRGEIAGGEETQAG